MNCVQELNTRYKRSTDLCSKYCFVFIPNDKLIKKKTRPLPPNYVEKKSQGLDISAGKYPTVELHDFVSQLVKKI